MRVPASANARLRYPTALDPERAYVDILLPVKAQLAERGAELSSLAYDAWLLVATLVGLALGPGALVGDAEARQDVLRAIEIQNGHAPVGEAL